MSLSGRILLALARAPPRRWARVEPSCLWELDTSLERVFELVCLELLSGRRLAGRRSFDSGESLLSLFRSPYTCFVSPFDLFDKVFRARAPRLFHTFELVFQSSSD